MVKKTIMGLILICIMFATIQTTATEQSYIDIILVTDDDIILNLTGTVNDNGTITIYIDGVEIKGELTHLWSTIEKVSKSASNANSKANQNRKYILTLQKDVQVNSEKIYLIRNEILAFEDDYLKIKKDYYIFKNETDTQIQLLHTYIDHLSGRITGEHQYINKWVDVGKKVVITFTAGYVLLSIGLIVAYHKIKKEKKNKTPHN